MLLLAAMAVPPAQASRLGDLKKSLSSFLTREKKVKKELHTVKAEQRAVQSGLIAAQRELDQAEAKLRASETQLRKTKQEIAETERELAATKARLAKHQTEMQQRLLAAYRCGEPTYLEVVFRATSFADFVNRAEFTRRLARHDEDLLTKLVSEKQAFERCKAELVIKRARQEDLRADIKQQRDVVRTRKAAADRELARVKRDRGEAERLLAEMEQESRRIEQMIARIQRGSDGQRYSGTWSGTLRCPIASSYRISSRYGWRRDPFHGRRRFHHGVDLACPTGTSIHAADKGLVVYAGWKSVYGKVVIIDHGSGISTVYAHCSSTSVGNGQVVKRGQVIAKVGSTGRSTGPHLHFEVRKYGKTTNPMKF